jgi:tetratricopeptide (TPR) repeat protein
MSKTKITEAVTSSDPKTKRWKSLFAAARMAYETGELRQAETLLARAMELAHELPEKDFAENTTEIGSAAVLLAEKRSKEADNRLKQCISKLEAYSDNAHKELLAVALRFHAQALIDLNDERDAESELKRSADILRALGYDAKVQLAYTLSDLCGLYLTQSRFSEAQLQITHAMKIAGDTLGPDSPHYVRADMIYATAMPMMEESRLEAASDAIARMRYFYGAHHPNITRAVERYLKVLEMRGDTARLEEAKETFLPPAKPHLK